MTDDWPNRIKDMDITFQIVDKYLERTGRDILSLDEVFYKKPKSNQVLVQIPDWVSTIACYFHLRYGDEQGKKFACRAITRVLLKNETIH